MDVNDFLDESKSEGADAPSDTDFKGGQHVSPAAPDGARSAEPSTVPVARSAQSAAPPKRSPDDASPSSLPPRAPSPSKRGGGSPQRNAVAPRPSTPAPGTQVRSDAPQPIPTPNLWGPDAAIMKQPSVVERDLADESLRKRRRIPRKIMIAIYIACVLAVIAAVTLFILNFAPTPDPGLIAQ